MSLSHLEIQPNGTEELGGVFPLELKIGSTLKEKDAVFNELIDINPELAWEQTVLPGFVLDLSEIL